jgi:hypothetical protein
MNLQGTPGKTKIVPIDPNNHRVDLDTIPNFSGGTFTQVTVDSSGRVIAGANPQTTQSSSVVTNTILQSAGVQAKADNYLGVQPNWTPPSGVIGLAIDTSNNRPWWYFNGGWN